jgi:FkbM family methyltransferase
MEVDNRIGMFEVFNSDDQQRNEFTSFLNHLDGKSTLLDVGCSYGAFGIAFVKKTGGTAYCFDGSLSVAIALTQTIELNKLYNVRYNRMLMGDENKLIGVAYDTHQSLINQQSSMQDIMLTVDTFCAMNEITPDCIKVDVEGFDYRVLLGAQECMKTYRPTMFMEIHPNFLRYYGNTIYDITNIADKMEYNILDCNGDAIHDYKLLLENEKTDSHRTVWIPR